MKRASLQADPLKFLYNRARRNREAAAATKVGFETAVLDTYVLEEHHMHNETKVNTNNPQSSPSDEKNVATNATDYVGSFPTPYGRTYIERRGASDFLAMRSRQLSSLLMLIHGNGLRHFQDMAEGTQDSVLWMAHQLAQEIEGALDFVQEPGFFDNPPPSS